MKRKIIYTLALLFAVLQALSQTTVSYTYDNLNRVTKVVYGNGATVNYTYDALGNRLTKKVTGTTATTHTINVAVVPTGAGTVTGAGEYSNGMMVELDAVANAGFKFQKWTDGPTENPRTVTVSQDITYTAQFVEDTTSTDLLGDIVIDGIVNYKDLNALIDAYLAQTSVTRLTDIDKDGQLTVADITKLNAIIIDGRLSLDSNGHEYVDLGLPSGTLWATCNVGADLPEEPGEFYAWGELEPKDDYSWDTYRWCDGTKPSSTNFSLTKYCDRGGYGQIDGKTSLELEDDVAHQLWGGDWHIPTQEEFQELADNCTIEWIKLDDNSNAYKFTGPNGKSITLPAAGYRNGTESFSNRFYYWSSELFMKDNPSNNHGNYALIVQSESDSTIRYTGQIRCKGYPVRPVMSAYSPKVNVIYAAPASYLGHDLVDLGLPSATLWATCNVGAETPEEYGCYYSWGEITGSCEGKTNFSLSYYKYYDGNQITAYKTDGAVLNAVDDAAAMKWGGWWQMPTLSQIDELMDTRYTTCVWTTENGVSGCRITSIVKGFEGNSIFLPAAGRYMGSRLNDVGTYGYYWSSSDYDDEPNYEKAYLMVFDGDYGPHRGHLYRYHGFTIRPVVPLQPFIEQVSSPNNAEQ